MKRMAGLNGPNRKVLLLIVVAVLLIGAWFLWRQTDTTGKSVEQMITDLKQSVTTKHQEVSAEDRTGYSTQVAYSASGYAYKTEAESPAGWHALFSNKDVQGKLPGDVKDEITAALKKNDFKIVTNPPVKPTYWVGDSTVADYYTRGDEVCFFSQYSRDAKATLICAPGAKFTEVALAAQPFVAPYTQAKNKQEADLAFDQPTIETNKAGTYRHAVVVVSELGEYNNQAGAFYYQKVDESNWHYFTSSQEGIDCEHTAEQPDAQAAFADICVSGGY